MVKMIKLLQLNSQHCDKSVPSSLVSIVCDFLNWEVTTAPNFAKNEFITLINEIYCFLKYLITESNYLSFLTKSISRIEVLIKKQF